MIRLPLWRVLALGLGLVGTSACSPTLSLETVGATAPGASDVRAYALAREIDPTTARVQLPPGAGTPVSATVRQDDRGRRVQRIVLSGDPGTRGENWIELRERDRRDRTPRVEDVAAEMRAALPGVSMRMDGAPGANAHGTFGLASGTDRAASAEGGVGCHFGWQRARLDGALDLRVRFCRTGLTREGAMAIMSGLRLADGMMGTVPITGRGAYDLPSGAHQTPSPGARRNGRQS